MDLSELPPIPSSHILAEVRWRRPTSLKFPRLKTFQDWPRRETWFQPEDFLVTTAKCFNWTIARGIMVWWKHQVIENMRCFSYYFLRLTSGLSSTIFVLKHLKTSFIFIHCPPRFFRVFTWLPTPTFCQNPRQDAECLRLLRLVGLWRVSIKKYVKQVLSLTSCILPHPYYNVIINDISSERCVFQEILANASTGRLTKSWQGRRTCRFFKPLRYDDGGWGSVTYMWNMSFEDGQSIQPAFTPPKKKNWAKALFGGF